MQDGQCCELEVGERYFNAIQGPGSLNVCTSSYQFSSHDRLAREPQPFFKTHQMRRGVNTRLVTRLLKDRLQHGAGRALAVGAGHGDHRAIKA